MGSSAFDDVLFPADPVADAPRILGRLRTFFPDAGALSSDQRSRSPGAARPPSSPRGSACSSSSPTRSAPAPARFDRLVVLGTVGAIAPPGDLSVPPRSSSSPTCSAAMTRRPACSRSTHSCATRRRRRRGRGTRDRARRLGSSPGVRRLRGRFPPGLHRPAAALPARIDRVVADLESRASADHPLRCKAYVALTAATSAARRAFDAGRQDRLRSSLDGQLGFDADRRGPVVQRAHRRPRQHPLSRAHGWPVSASTWCSSRSADTSGGSAGRRRSRSCGGTSTSTSTTLGRAAACPARFGLADAIRTGRAGRPGATGPRPSPAAARASSRSPPVRAAGARAPARTAPITQQVAPARPRARPPRRRAHRRPDTVERPHRVTSDPTTGTSTHPGPVHPRLAFSTSATSRSCSAPLVRDDAVAVRRGGVRQLHHPGRHRCRRRSRNDPARTARASPLPHLRPRCRCPPSGSPGSSNFPRPPSSPLRLRSNAATHDGMSFGRAAAGLRRRRCPATLQVQPCDPAVARCLPLAEQAAPGLRILEAHEP